GEGVADAAVPVAALVVVTQPVRGDRSVSVLSLNSGPARHAPGWVSDALTGTQRASWYHPTLCTVSVPVIAPDEFVRIQASPSRASGGTRMRAGFRSTR